MNTRAAGRQAVQWILRIATSPVRSSVQPGRRHVWLLQPPSTACRLLCSSTGQSPLQSAPHNHKPAAFPRQPVTELSRCALLDMGFTDIQAEEVYETVSKAKGANASKHALSTLTALFVLGLNPSTVLKMLQKSPELYGVKDSQLHQRIGNLRKLGLVEGSLQRVVVHHPQILTMPVKRIKNVVIFLREKCMFTGQQVTDILRDSPAVVEENPAQLEYKFQYVYFRMGVKQAEMVKSRLFRFTLDEVRSRHCFLERRGQYQTPDKKGQTIIINPKLNDILCADQAAYLTDIAKASAEEYDVFQKLMVREWKEEDQRQSYTEDDSDDDEEEGEEHNEEDEETGGRSGYMKRRKK
ncbi:transcription termination factor 4, mitochondrial [Myripristis murdjan]|uniref:Mitochondrial transcription termination factor 4 n=1 Tax=Myripristis murdjan TaxID=586833 RepID=A0A667XDQ4_9TELE|nr:transcription termination factor 4, mitochondrial-like [Myripristis murdjan]